MSSTAPGKAERGGDTRERLLLTALHLYAREGLHAVSLRRISAESGSRNSGAMHYHFDNKLGVVEALMAMLSEELRSIAEELPVTPRTERSLRSACRDTLLPLVELRKRQPWGSDAVRFLSRLVSENDPELAALANTMFAPFWQRLDSALGRAVPELPAPVRQLRLMFISVNVLHGMAEVGWLSRSPLGDLGHFDGDDLLDHLVDYLIGGLEAPSHDAAPPTALSM